MTSLPPHATIGDDINVPPKATRFDSYRRPSDSEQTVIDPNEDFKTTNKGGDTKTYGQPENEAVDTSFAAQINPSRLRGRALMAMITFVSGTGFTL